MQYKYENILQLSPFLFPLIIIHRIPDLQVHAAEATQSSPPSSMIAIKAAAAAFATILLPALSLASTETFNATVSANVFRVP